MPLCVSCVRFRGGACRYRKALHTLLLPPRGLLCSLTCLIIQAVCVQVGVHWAVKRGVISNWLFLHEVIGECDPEWRATR